MKTYISLELSHPEDLPDEFKHDDIRYPESLVEYFLDEYTQPGDVVLDPFAGFGTSLVVAERMGRIPYGVEIDREKATFTKSRLVQPENLIHGDSRNLKAIDLPMIDFSITSPPYTTKDGLEDPFTDYQIKGKGYAAYLNDIRNIYGQLRGVMKPASFVVLEVSNLKMGGKVTTLAWDVAGEISKVLHFEGEIVVCWDKYDYGYNHSYCLVFSSM